MHRLAFILCLLCVGLLALSQPGRRSDGRDARIDDPHATVRGMTVSCHTWGWEWGTDDFARTLDELQALGVNWVAIHPYASIRSNGEVVMRDRAYEDTEWLTRPIAEAHARGMKIVIHPHIAYWGSPFSWRGEIEFTSDDDWARFFSTYRAWIMRIVEVCSDADAFVVGNELDLTVRHEKEWRALIASVRERFAGPLTYAANWDRYHLVPFWDALDVIGIQAYFPLATDGGQASDAELLRGWQRALEPLRTLSRKVNREVLFTEIGYDRAAHAALRPWESGRRRGRDNAEAVVDDAIQRRCLRIAVDVIERERFIRGALLWKWFPDRPGRGDFLMSAPGPRAEIEAAWGPHAPDVPMNMETGVDGSS